MVTAIVLAILCFSACVCWFALTRKPVKKTLADVSSLVFVCGVVAGLLLTIFNLCGFLISLLKKKKAAPFGAVFFLFEFAGLVYD